MNAISGFGKGTEDKPFSNEYQGVQLGPARPIPRIQKEHFLGSTRRVAPIFDKSKGHDLMVMRAVRVLCVILTSWFLAFFSSKNEVSSWSTAFKRYVFLQQAASKLMVTFDKNVCHQHQTGPSPTKGWFKEGPIQTLKLYLEREIKAGVLCLW